MRRSPGHHFGLRRSARAEAERSSSEEAGYWIAEASPGVGKCSCRQWGGVLSLGTSPTPRRIGSPRGVPRVAEGDRLARRNVGSRRGGAGARHFTAGPLARSLTRDARATRVATPARAATPWFSGSPFPRTDLSAGTPGGHGGTVVQFRVLDEAFSMSNHFSCCFLVRVDHRYP